MRVAPTLPAHSIAPRSGCWATGIASLDSTLSGGLGYGRVHEIYAADTDDASSAAGFAAAVAAGMGSTGQATVWLRERRRLKHAGILQASGWAELGGAPERGLVGIVPDTLSLLRAAADTLRCSGLGAVILEGRGPMRELDLTASRRLVLAAEKSGVPLLLLRIDAAPVPSAASTRWQVAAAPSRALPGNAPGLPAFDLTLLRQRSGPCGQDWRLEWDRDQRKFHEAPVSGAVVSVPADGSLAARASPSARPGTRRAA